MKLEAEDIIDSHAEVLDGNEAVGSVPAAIARLRSLQEMDPEDFVCSPCSTYYRIDGLCNNLDNPTWGAAFMTYIRELPNSYQDGKNIPRLYEGGTTDPLPSARLVSTECLPSLKEEGDLDLDKTHSQIVMQFGQFFAHDLVETGDGCTLVITKSLLHLPGLVVNG
nr:hypothetical protein BaRGS_011832 [Batillaria attramentaria]